MRTVAGLLLGLSLMIVLVGCEATARSDRSEPHWQTTASYDKIMSVPATQPSPIENRIWSETVATYEAPVVAHFGSYFNDPMVSDIEYTYGWTLMDLASVAYSPARFAVNTVAVPVSMVKEPPGVLQSANLDQPIGETNKADKK
ncbi:MAG: hypothetical protein WC975_09610 [Phycisphaerae bacterium]